MRNLGFLIFAVGALEAHDAHACSFDSGNLCFSLRSDEKISLLEHEALGDSRGTC